MKTNLPRSAALALLSAALCFSGLPSAIHAAPPDHAEKGGKGKGNADRGAGQGKGKSHQDSDDGRAASRGERGGAAQVQSRSGGTSLEVYFDDRRRVAVREYYGEQVRGGKCPPGLAKKNNGCLPPGQARKWTVGRPLPRDVVFYEVPQSLVVRLGPAPAGHRYVRVAADILLIAVGTSMVIDAIQDLGSM